MCVVTNVVAVTMVAVTTVAVTTAMHVVGALLQVGSSFTVTISASLLTLILHYVSKNVPSLTGCSFNTHPPFCLLLAHVISRHSTRSPATAGIANRPLLFLEHRIPMPELFTVRRFTRVLEAGKYACPY